MRTPEATAVNSIHEKARRDAATLAVQNSIEDLPPGEAAKWDIGLGDGNPGELRVRLPVDTHPRHFVPLLEFSGVTIEPAPAVFNLPSRPA